jgi:hypothetical protein
MNMKYKRNVAYRFYACVNRSVPPTVDMWSLGIKYTNLQIGNSMLKVGKASGV